MDNASVSISVAFNDDTTRRLFEANTMETERRIEALYQLKQAGVRTGALLCPVIPYITDVPKLIKKLLPCADVIWIYGLSVRDRLGESWQNTEKILKSNFPELFKQVEKVVFSKEHLYWTDLREKLESMKKSSQLNLNIHI
jgi:DNA repair photolyase